MVIAVVTNFHMNTQAELCSNKLGDGDLVAYHQDPQVSLTVL